MKSRLIGGSGTITIIAPFPGAETFELERMLNACNVAYILEPHGKL